jgi:hypothetical protein
MYGVLSHENNLPELGSIPRRGKQHVAMCVGR